MSPVRIGVWAVIAVVSVDLVFFTGAYGFSAAAQSRVVTHCILAAIAVVVVANFKKDPAAGWSPIIPAAMACLLAVALATVFSERPAASVERFAISLLMLPAYLGIRSVVWSDWLQPRFDRLVALTTIAVLVVYAGQILLHWVPWWAAVGPAVPPLRPGNEGLTTGSVNGIAMYLELLAPIGCWLVWMHWRSRALFAGSVTLAAFGLLVTGSRGAWVGVGAGVVFTLAALWAVRRRSASGPARHQLRQPVRVAMAVGLVAAVALFLPAVTSRLLAGDTGRFELWSGAVGLITTRPLFGIGPGAYAAMRADTVVSEANLAVLATSHNGLLQVLLDAGILGIAAVAWLMFAAIRVASAGIRDAPTAGEQILRILSTAGLLAAGVHSLFDPQWYVVGVMILSLHAFARLDPPTTAAIRHRRMPAGLLAMTALAILILIPIDIAMVRAQLGNNALGRGDPRTALTEFAAANHLHQLPPYLLGEAIARSELGDAAGAVDAAELAGALQGYPFMLANLAALQERPDASVARIEATGRWDPTAMVNAAVLRAGSDPAAAAADLGDAMAAVPSLVYSERPAQLFDEATWARAQGAAIASIGASDPALAHSLALVADRADLVAELAFVVSDPAAALLAAWVRDGAFELEEALAVLRDHHASPSTVMELWILGFEARSQELIDAVRGVATAEWGGGPQAPMELVIDGRADANYSMRLPRWPMASDERTGPARPYVGSMVTIEPVFRPKP